MNSSLAKLAEVIACVCLSGLCGVSVYGQSSSTASRKLDLSGFGGVGGAFTGLGGSATKANGASQSPGLGGRNLLLVLGVDLGLYDFCGLRFMAEVRGATPLYKGHVDGQEFFLAGVRAAKPLRRIGFLRLQLYADVLAGRGAIRYVDGGYRTPSQVYLSSSSTVYGAGGGVEAELSRRWALQADAQIQRWNTPLPGIESIHSKQGGIQLVYHYGAGEWPR